MLAACGLMRSLRLAALCQLMGALVVWVQKLALAACAFDRSADRGEKPAACGLDRICMLEAGPRAQGDYSPSSVSMSVYV